MNAGVTPETFATRVIALLGGREKARQALDESHQETASSWAQDAPLIGRILRAHLFVEHFLGLYVSARNPTLGDLRSARLSFAQKLALANLANDPAVSYLVPGVARLNTVRNRIAHSLHAEITNDDKACFLAIGLFKAMRDAIAAPNPTSEEPIDVLEDFGKHAGLMFSAASSPHRHVFEEAARPGIDKLEPK